MKSTVISLLLLGTVFFCSNGHAEYYHYVDENGVRHYTDDLSEVPIQDLPVIDVIDEVEAGSAPEPLEPALEETGEASLPSRESGLGTQMDTEGLGRVKKELDGVYVDLLREKETLLKSKNRLSAKAYQEKVGLLNDKIENYKKKNNAFKDRVEHHNKKLLDDYLYN